LLRGHNYIGTEHILLAMLADEDSPAGRILREAGVSLDAADAWISAELSKL
jgi:ATP-dependent Clp protease ATP-binding subunit ClpA